jgi:hypothetical protein
LYIYLKNSKLINFKIVGLRHFHFKHKSEDSICTPDSILHFTDSLLIYLTWNSWTLLGNDLIVNLTPKYYQASSLRNTNTIFSNFNLYSSWEKIAEKNPNVSINTFSYNHLLNQCTRNTTSITKNYFRFRSSFSSFIKTNTSIDQPALQLIWHSSKSNNTINWNIILSMFPHHTSQTFNHSNFCCIFTLLLIKLRFFRKHNNQSKIGQCHNLHAASSSNNI